MDSEVGDDVEVYPTFVGGNDKKNFLGICKSHILYGWELFDEVQILDHALSTLRQEGDSIGPGIARTSGVDVFEEFSRGSPAKKDAIALEKIGDAFSEMASYTKKKISLATSKTKIALATQIIEANLKLEEQKSKGNDVTGFQKQIERLEEIQDELG